jgi:hypothetical protein
MIGRWVEQGEAPADEALLGEMVQNICFNNARDYLRLSVSIPTKRLSKPICASWVICRCMPSS